MEVTRHQTLRDERFNEAEAIDHLERGRMGCGRSWTVIHPGLGFEKRHDETALSARERGDDANGACAGNDDAWVLHLLYLMAAPCRACAARRACIYLMVSPCRAHTRSARAQPLIFLVAAPYRACIYLMV